MLSSKTLYQTIEIVRDAQKNISYGPEQIHYGPDWDAKRAGAERGLNMWNEYDKLLYELEDEYRKVVAIENANRVSEEKENATKA